MVKSAKAAELNEMSDTLEKELEICKTNKKKIGSLSIKLQSFCRMLDKEDQQDPQIRQLVIKKKYFLNQVRVLNTIQARERNEMEREMAECNMPIERFSEATDTSMTMKDRDFYAAQSSRMDDFILSTMDSLDSIKKQGVYIERARDRLRTGLVRLGVSGELISKIESRLSRDKTIFIALFVLVCIGIILLRFYFR